MPIYDNNGTTSYEIGTIYDNNGTTNTQIGYVYDNNGTTNSLIYQAWNGELLDGSDGFSDVTGGWDATLYTGNTWMVDAEVTDDGIAIFSGSGTWHEIGTVNKVDVSSYSTITFTVSCPNGCYTLNIHFGLYNNQSTVYNQGVTAVSESNYTNTSTTTRTYTLDVSSLTTSYYLALYCYAGSGYPATVTKIVMS